MRSKSDWPPKFSVNESGVLDLFTGDRFYSSSDAALREAILNSIDACGRRQSSSGEEYSPKINVIFDRSDKIITIEDNGDGMTKEGVKDLFTEIASSAAELVQNAEDDYQAVGEFGIGVLSYFLVCEEYELHSIGDSGEPIGIRLTDEMLDAETQAKSIEPKRQQQGTTLVLPVYDSKTFDHLKERFPHWIRDVSGLSAKLAPDDERVTQGGLTTDINQVDPKERPEWTEEVHIGPPSKFNSWEHLDGDGEVDLLYRGVFVEKIKLPKLWGLEGAIHVDPKKFEAKLNREGFIGEKDKERIKNFLEKLHPSVLENALKCVQQIDFGGEKNWDKLRWVNVWLAIPRTQEYHDAARTWDNEFRDLRVFKLLLPNGKSKSVSVADITEIDSDEVFIGPPNLRSLNDIGRQAVRVLRARDIPVIQGQKRKGSYLRNASYVGTSSQDVLDYFSDELPSLVSVTDREEEIVRTEHEVSIFPQSPEVLIVRLGSEGSPLVKVGQEIWVNLDTEDGKNIIQEVCDRNEGHIGLWLACLKYAHTQADGIASILRGSTDAAQPLGIVKRQYLRRLTG